MEKKIKTFEEFSQAVEELAGEKYFAVTMEKTRYSKGLGEETRKTEYHYKSYIEGGNWYSGYSPEEAIMNLKKSMGLVPDEVIEAEIK